MAHFEWATTTGWNKQPGGPRWSRFFAGWVPNVDARPPIPRPSAPRPVNGWMQLFFLDVARFCMYFFLNGQ